MALKSKNNNMKNKTVIVAGGNGLIGTEIVKTARQQGADVFSMDIHFKSDININLTDKSELISVLNEHNPDIFINSTYPKNTFDHIVAYLRTTPIIANHMAEVNNGGSIVLLSSIYGIVGCDPRLYADTEVLIPQLDYQFVKGGINALVKGVATLFGSLGVRCNAVSPGGVYDGQDPLFVERYNEHVPLRRMCKPEEVAEAVCFLAGEKASYLTGHNLVLGGGLTNYAWL